MLALYPKRLRLFALLSILLIAVIAALILLNPAANPVVWIILGVFGVLALLVSESNAAMQDHQRELARLYNQLDAEGFVRDYSRHLQNKTFTQDTAVMVRMHLSNAYVALGEFDKAAEVLTSFTLKEEKKEEKTLLLRFAMSSNLCYIAEQKEDIAEAQRRLDDLLQLKARLEKLQEGKPAQKRMSFSTDLNEQCLRLLKDGHADIELLKNTVQAGNREVLPRVTTSLWIARAYLADNQRREAEKLFRRIVELAPALHPGKEAARILATLPENGD